jgi:hypothetical protein
MKRSLLIALLSTALMVAYASLVMGGNRPGEPTSPTEDGRLPDTRFGGYSGEDLSAYFSALGPENVETYSRMLAIWDNLFPLVYGAMNMAWLAFLFQAIPIKKFRWLIVALPLFGMGMDFCENFFIRAQLLLFQGGETHLDAGLASLFTQLKWCVSLPLNGLIFIGIVVAAVRSYQRRKKSKS